MCPKAWSDKDERKYEHIKDSAEERGESTKRAKEIAARTVNKTRSEEGRTKTAKKQGKKRPIKKSGKKKSGTKKSGKKRGSK